jgi:hypothetical protein
MISETEEDARREKKAIDTFVSTFKGSYQKLDPMDVDFKIFDKDKKLIAYAEVMPRIRTMRDAYPVHALARKVVKLIDKRIPPVLIWSCDDGIIYTSPKKVDGYVKWIKGDELMIYYDKQKEFKYVRFSK